MAPFYMSKKIFDLGSHNIMLEWWQYLWDDKFNIDNLCKDTWLKCYNIHKPETCDRKRVLNCYMWTRRR